jgi:hypothetical protein
MSRQVHALPDQNMKSRSADFSEKLVLVTYWIIGLKS